MTIDQINVIDLIGIDKTTGIAMLTIADHLDWEDLQSHEILLQEKLNAYLRFIEGGEILIKYPKANGREIVIEIAFKYPPPDKAIIFLENAQKFLRDSGYDLIFNKGEFNK